jgi:hypothetical protein
VGTIETPPPLSPSHATSSPHATAKTIGPKKTPITHRLAGDRGLVQLVLRRVENMLGVRLWNSQQMFDFEQPARGGAVGGADFGPDVHGGDLEQMLQRRFGLMP